MKRLAAPSAVILLVGAGIAVAQAPPPLVLLRHKPKQCRHHLARVTSGSQVIGTGMARSMSGSPGTTSSAAIGRIGYPVAGCGTACRAVGLDRRTLAIRKQFPLPCGRGTPPNQRGSVASRVSRPNAIPQPSPNRRRIAQPAVRQSAV
jgi:hypothetical protein